MKRFHVHVNVDQLDRSITFYTTLFGTAPTVVKPDYAKWMLDDPRVNFAISQRGRQTGVDHLGMQAEDDAELAAIGTRLQAADAVALAEKGTTCCYARSDKFWAEDPQGVRWETFRTHGEATTYTSASSESVAACCGPTTRSEPAASCGPNTGCC
ncbi:glyoxalase/bleomycin resistance/dioxygenase family protein [Rhodanobacter glycinis]|uniref:ArsI/CadI family heavy metal resistance metalloenzyme n=1 Tax=Rhodanobacter glycinis TaxID=582702 RepID=UPI001128355B|nr:ArsI/CadI family heavy metal resistance metalloenzyme [Rhodanobacter glycinis]TPG46188.1 glyoxalase/bleomycin resistance/dioxygenase family protein [Rhodanobacter glycinis]